MIIVRETQLRRETTRMQLHALDIFIFIEEGGGQNRQIAGKERDLAKEDFEVARKTASE